MSTGGRSTPWGGPELAVSNVNLELLSWTGFALFVLSGVVAEIYVRPMLDKLKCHVSIDQDDEPPIRIELIMTIVIITIITVVICLCIGIATSAMIRA